MPRIIAVAAIAGLALGATSPSARDDVRVPAGSVPTIDGTIGAGEWRDALPLPLGPADTVYLKHADGDLYAGLKGNERAIASLCVVSGGGVRILHASAALGAAHFARRGSAWQRERDFAWSLRATDNSDSTRTQRDAHHAREGWVANNIRTGTTGHVEYRIALGRLDGPPYALGVTSHPVPSETLHGWPAGLGDGCADLRLVQGFTDTPFTFEPAGWGRLTLVPARGRD